MQERQATAQGAKDVRSMPNSSENLSRNVRWTMRGTAMARRFATGGKTWVRVCLGARMDKEGPHEAASVQ